MSAPAHEILPSVETIHDLPEHTGSLSFTTVHYRATDRRRQDNPATNAFRLCHPVRQSQVTEAELTKQNGCLYHQFPAPPESELNLIRTS